ncbi:MAG: hypothetical protein SWK90_19720 [Chloroflexota bacterium]|nr:hypothetical protein [Chloroflexota bacterium]
MVITLTFTYPLIIQMNTHFAGDNIDVWLNMWANWWTRRSLREGLPFYHTTAILHPHGTPLYFHSFSHTHTALWLLLEPLAGPLAAYNTTVLVAFTLLGFGIYLVVHELTGHAGAGFVAGLAATFAPYHAWECAHPTLFSTHYIPLLLWALITLFRRPNWWRGVLAGIFFTLNALASWHQLVYSAVIAGPYLAWSLFTQRERWEKHLWHSLLVALLVAAVLTGPIVLPLLREQTRAGYAETNIDWVFNTDVLALVTPSFFHPLWGETVRPLYDRFPAPNRPAFVGYIVLVLALLGLPRLHREHGWLVITTLLALVLALGTRLYVNGYAITPNLPWYTPIIGFVRTPIRFNLVLGQCLAILAGFGVTTIKTRLQKSVSLAIVHCSLLIVPLVSALVLFEFLAYPFPTTRAHTPPFYAQLAQEPGSYAIVEAPLDRQTDKFYMYWQTVHGKSLVNGHVSRPPTLAFDFIQGNGITHAFAQREPLRGRAQLGAELAALAEADVRYIIVHKQLLSPELAGDWIAALATRPVHEDDDLIVFATRPEPGVNFGVERDFNGLLLSQVWLEPGQPPMLESHWITPERHSLTLTLRAVEGKDKSPPYSQVLAVEKGPFSIVRVPLSLPDLPAGEYELLLSNDAASFTLPQRLVVTPDGWFAARLQPNVTWNDSLALRGIDWHRLANTLYVDLQWQARQTPGGDFKFFVHLLPQNEDSSDVDGPPAAQFDGMPCHWTHPTSLWRMGELVADQALVDLRGIPAGTYRLAIGWYVPDTNERLAGINATGQPLPEGRLLLDHVIVIP